MHKTTKIIISLEGAAMLFLVAATVIGIIKGHWFNVACNLIWIGVAAMLLVQAVRNDKALQEKEALRVKNFELHAENSELKYHNKLLKSKIEKEDEGDKTVRWFKERFVELTLKMEQHHGEAKEIRISPYYHTKKVEIDF